MRSPRLALLCLALLWPGAARAQEVVADLSSHLIAITTGFTGTSVVLFGATEAAGDVIAVVRGPEREVTIWRKDKIAGIWANAESVTFRDVPSFYALAASGPLGELLDPTAAERYRIGVNYLDFRAADEVSPERERLFTAALIGVQRRAGAFLPDPGSVIFLGKRLFRTTFSFPTTVPTGTYRADIYLVRDKQVIDMQTTPLLISRLGVDAAVFDFAQRRPLVYGAIAVIMAVMAGWAASLPFRNS
jgi:uncharacterized protein (TIGR02186 family)